MNKTQFQIFLENTKFTKTENDEGQKKYIISGPFAMADKPNLNRRIYPKNVLNKAIEAIRSDVANKRIRIGFDHPEWGASKLASSAAILTEVTDVQPDGMAYYKAQIIDTDAGRNLKVILDAGSLVGVSTRGYGSSKYKEVEGLTGEYEVLDDDYELCSFDFVDDPSVKQTEEMMQLENDKRSNHMKTFADIKKAYPEIIGKYEQEKNDEINTLKESVQKSETKLAETNSKLDKLVKSLKDDFSDMFEVVEESKLVNEKNEMIQKLTNESKEITTEKDELAEKVAKLESEALKLEKENAIAKIKADDPEYFNFAALVEKFDICMTVEDVQKVYEDGKKLIADLKKDEQVAEPKTEAKKDKLPKDEQLEADMKRKNAQRLSCGLKPYTLEEYKKLYSK